MGHVAFVEPHGGVSPQRVSAMHIPCECYLTLKRSFDGKVKVWSIDTRACVATHSETEKAIWSVKWLAKIGRSVGFATAGANRSISFYREATGG